MFPGQGSQHVGMGKALYDAYPAAREVFGEIDEVLGQSLSKVMFEGPEDQLILTENSQPALMAASLAVVKVLEGEGAKLADLASYVAGHSLGEFSALASVNALGIGDTARILRRRGLAMQKAVPVGEGAMAAILGLDLETVVEVAKEAAQDGVCAPANDNAPGQVVVSGDKQAVERAIEIAKEKGAKRGILLPVSAPFHCPLMEPAAEDMRAALDDVEIKTPDVPVICNVSAEPETDPGRIRELLGEQVTGMVRWRESVLKLSALGVNTVVECGAGKVLTGLAKRIDPELNALSIQSPEDVDAFMETLK